MSDEDRAAHIAIHKTFFATGDPNPETPAFVLEDVPMDAEVKCGVCGKTHTGQPCPQNE